MNNEEILKKAIEKAVKGGYGFIRTRDWYLKEPERYLSLIFSHSFAKAFWKKEKSLPYYKDGLTYSRIPAWEYHLQQMVLEEQPLQYIRKFL